MAAEQVYVAWTAFQRRQLSMAPHLGFECHFIAIDRKAGRLKKAFLYLKAFAQTISYLRKEQPRVVWVQLPQTPVLWAALLYRATAGRAVKVVADCHNAMFRKPWNALPLGNWSVTAADAVLVHNTDMVAQAVQQGFPSDRLLVVEDPPATFPATTLPPPCVAEMDRPYMVFPASFAFDEPIEQLLDAARACPEINVVVTGNPARYPDQAVIQAAPPNVKFVGFLPHHDFDGLILHAVAILALTKFDGIQLSVCGEAVGASKPMVVSGTPLLRRLFPEGSFYVEGDQASDLVSAIQSAVRGAVDAGHAMGRFRHEVAERWKAERLRPLQSLLAQ